jgi:cytochrome c biogenesis protein CcdA
VLPFVFARSDQPFTRSGLPILLGMAITFAAVASLATVGGGWVVEANHLGRLAAILLMALFGITLVLPRLSERMTRPIVALGARLSQTAGADGKGASFGSSLVLGVATGLLWAPCAGPILGLLLTGAALNGASLGTSFLLLAYAAGAATSLAVALLIGGKVFHAPEFAFERNIDNVRAAMKRLGIDYPVAIDNNYAIWRGFNNEYWPAHYFIDAEGRIRHHHFGEGDYAESEHVIQELLREAAHQTVASGTVSVSGTGVEEAAQVTRICRSIFRLSAAAVTFPGS